MAVRGRTWNDDEVQALLAIWADTSIQRQRWGTLPFSRLAGAAAKGLPAQHEAVLGEIKAAEEVQRSGRRTSLQWSLSRLRQWIQGAFISFLWFSEIHSVMGGRGEVIPPALLDTSSPSFRSSDEQAGDSTLCSAMPALAEGPHEDLKGSNQAIQMAINYCSQPLLLQNLLRTHLDSLSHPQSSLDHLP